MLKMRKGTCFVNPVGVVVVPFAEGQASRFVNVSLARGQTGSRIDPSFAECQSGSLAKRQPGGACTLSVSVNLACIMIYLY